MMQALVLHKVGDARYETVPRPTAGPGEVLVRVGFCGVCGSDIPRTFVKGNVSAFPRSAATSSPEPWKAAGRK